MPILAGFEGLARNTDHVEDTDSWGIMFDPQYKGFTSYIVSDFLSVVMLYLGYDGDFVTYMDKPEEAQAATNAGARLPDQAQGHGAQATTTPARKCSRCSSTRTSTWRRPGPGRRPS